MTTIAGAPPAGWYDDPADPSLAWRWWDGSQWAAHTSAKFTSSPLAQHTPAVPVGGDAEVGSPYTAGIWLMATLPILGLVLAGVSRSVATLSGLVIPVEVVLPILAGFALLFGALDRSALRARGYAIPSLLWMLLLPPIAYLIARGRLVRWEKRSAWPPELVFAGGALVVGLLALAVPTVSAPAPYVASGAIAGEESSSDIPDATPLPPDGGPLEIPLGYIGGGDPAEGIALSIEIAYLSQGIESDVDCTQPTVITPGSSFACTMSYPPHLALVPVNVDADGFITISDRIELDALTPGGVPSTGTPT